MHLVFVHGWGLGPDIWKPILEQLDYKLKTNCVDLGFFHEPNNLENLEPGSIYVGHSLGFLWLLKQAPKQPKALISISGFDRFVPHTNPRIIQSMQKGLDRDVNKQLRMFWANAGIPDYENQEKPNKTRLIEGLQWLNDWDSQEELKQLDCPALVLAAENDNIVPRNMSCNIWGEHHITWSETGGHLLPVTRPDWTAQKITEFIHALK